MSIQGPQPSPRPWDHPSSKVLLQKGSDIVVLKIVDVDDESSTLVTYTTSKDARIALSSKPRKSTKIRIISIYSKRTIAPLDIPGDLLEHVFQEYSLNRDFADVVSSFGQDPNIAEGSSNNATIYNKDSGACDKYIGNSTSFSPPQISYQMRYVEPNQRGGKDPWSLRHTGVFHRHAVGNESPDIFILLHPVREPASDCIIAALEGDSESATAKRRELCSNPFRLHTSLFDYYFYHWRWYFRYLGERFAEENNLAMVVKPERAEPKSSFLRVQSLRNTNDFVLFSQACCSGNLDLLTRLGQCPSKLLRNLDEVQSHHAKMKGYIESADVLKGRIQNSIDLVGYTLTLHNQLEAAKMDTELRDLTEGLKKLTEDTVDDSATVKIVTFLSAVYLPGSFIGTLFGMNFFLFDQKTKKLQISPDFWIFAATWLPLTLLTGATYIVILYIDSRIKGKRFRWPWQMKSKGILPPPSKLE